MYFLQPRAGDVGVDLRRRQVTVAEEHLHDAQVGTVVKQVGGEGVTQGVGGKGFADAGDFGLMLDAVPEGLAGHLFTALTGKQHVAGPTVEQFVASIAHVTLDPDDGLLPHRHQTLLAALAHDAQHALAQVDLLKRQADQLGHAQAAGVEHFQHGPVALTNGVAQVGRGEQRFDIGFGQGFGKWLTQLRHVDLQRRVDRDQLFSEQVTIEAAHAGKQTRRGARLVAVVDPPPQVVENRFATDTHQIHAPFLQPTVEQREVAAIGIARVVRQPLLQPQGVEKAVDHGMVNGGHGF